MAEIGSSENAPFSFESGHTDLIHDVAIDFYGKTLASASSDRIIRIFEIVNDKKKHILIGELKGHKGPIWKLSWAHPKFGCILASCSYDKQLIIWQRQNGQNGQWIKTFCDEFKSSVNTVQFYPSKLELIAGSSDGSIKIYTRESNNKWKIAHHIKDGHNGGVNSISWCSNTSDNDIKEENKEENKRFVTGGCDNLVKIWNFESNSNKYSTCATLNQHENWVRHVNWSPIPTSRSHSIVASCSEDKTVIIWKENNKKWTVAQKIKCQFKVWNVSWSELGNILAIALGENTVQLYKEGNDGKWGQVSKIN